MLQLVIYIRPLLSSLPFIAKVQDVTNLSVFIYIIFPIIWVSSFTIYSVYDGKRNIRIVDEFASLTQATLVAAISMAGILYFTYRDVSRALFVIFVHSTFLVIILWRSAARIYFRAVREGLAKPQRVLIAGAGLVGREMQKKLFEHVDLNLRFIGFLDDNVEKRNKGPNLILGSLADMRAIVEKHQPWQRQRFAVPQGLTGWWQIHGRSDRPMHLHTEDDLYYVNHYSIWLDIEICLKTIWIVIRGSGAY